MNVSTSFQGNIAVCRVQGRFDFSAHRDFNGAINVALENATVREIQIGLGDLDYIDSAALGMLLVAKDKAKLANKTIYLANPVGKVKQVLDIANFTKYFDFK